MECLAGEGAPKRIGLVPEQVIDGEAHGQFNPLEGIWLVGLLAGDDLRLVEDQLGSRRFPVGRVAVLEE